MAYDRGYAQIFRDSLAQLSGVCEKKMFGGLCFFVNGNMLCGVHQAGGMARVGKENEPAALAIRGVSPLSFTGRKMGGIVEMTPEAVEEDQIREAVLQLAIQFVGDLPAK